MYIIPKFLPKPQLIRGASKLLIPYIITLLLTNPSDCSLKDEPRNHAYLDIYNVDSQLEVSNDHLVEELSLGTHLAASND